MNGAAISEEPKTLDPPELGSYELGPHIGLCAVAFRVPPHDLEAQESELSLPTWHDPHSGPILTRCAAILHHIDWTTATVSASYNDRTTAK